MIHSAEACRVGVAAGILVSAISTGAISAENALGFRIFSVKEARVVYALSGTRTGTKTLTFSDYGSRTRQETHATTTVMGRTLQDDSVVYTDAEWIYTLDLKTNKATKQRNPLGKDVVNRDDTSRTFKTPEEYVRAMGGERNGDDEVLGHRCDIWDIKPFSTKACVTKEGILLWTEAKLGGVAVKEVAAEVTIGSLPKEATALPEGITFVEVQDPLEQLRQMRKQAGDRPAKKKRGRPLTPEEMEEAKKMRDAFSSNDSSQIQEQIKKLQERFTPPAQPGQ